MTKHMSAGLKNKSGGPLMLWLDTRECTVCGYGALRLYLPRDPQMHHYILPGSCANCIYTQEHDFLHGLKPLELPMYIGHVWLHELTEAAYQGLLNELLAPKAQ